MVKVIESRSLSLALADELGVRHASPQVILIKRGKAIWHTSHYKITDASITTAIANGEKA
ncbi:hypothetical protein AYW79_07865 [Ferroacidibacillus organovorans]|uniref:Uncharacterized protein n=1 Tax=Ferroacidibacillus organovorans TaxID=1765683 RepID=A0A853KA88_9BACL|nr:hypothetical protein AYJ22_10165 [Ferroacidibacillus organovorans]OAG93936.1 hypothetical protein AYW79_07865 [Ferroacidibacillus organovorans]